jgi:xanthine dehydrogenase accessory factor
LAVLRASTVRRLDRHAPDVVLAMNDTLHGIMRWADRGDRIAIAMVVGAVRSAPRPLGTKMAINDRGEISGSVSGGCVEGAVVEIAERVISSGRPELAHFGIDDSEAWGVGLPCGGEIDVWVQAYEPEPFEDAARSGARAAEVTPLAGPRAGAKLVITPDGGRFGSLGSAEADAEAASVASELLWTDVSTRRGSRSSMSSGRRRACCSSAPSISPGRSAPWRRRWACGHM